MKRTNFEIPEEVSRIINKYYPADSKSRYYYYTHVVKVTELALLITDLNPHLRFDLKSLIYGSMLHDIGILRTNAPEIGCFGDKPYICHTYLGREMLEEEGLPDIAPVCERHLGVGLSKEDIIKSGFPLPHRDMIPITLEEKLVCYADKFFSKSESHLLKAKPMEKVNKKILKYGEDKIQRFEELKAMFGMGFYEYL